MADSPNHHRDVPFHLYPHPRTPRPCSPTKDGTEGTQTPKRHAALQSDRYPDRETDSKASPERCGARRRTTAKPRRIKGVCRHIGAGCTQAAHSRAPVQRAMVGPGGLSSHARRGAAERQVCQLVSPFSHSASWPMSEGWRNEIC